MVVSKNQYDEHIGDKSKEQLLEGIGRISQVGSPVYEQMRLAIMVRCTQDLQESISALKTRIGTLDIILKIATAIGGIATTLMAYKIFFP